MANVIGVGVVVLIISGLVGYIAHGSGLAQGQALAQANCATEKAEAKQVPTQ